MFPEPHQVSQSSLCLPQQHGPSANLLGHGHPALDGPGRIEPKWYLRYVFPFELGENYDINKGAQILEIGYDALTKSLPVPIADSDGIKRIAIKDLRSPVAFPMTYADLKAKHFPLSAFDGDTLRRRSVWPLQGERLPISLVQASFIPGRLILTWCIFHMFGDANTFPTWVNLWAAGCCRAQGLETSWTDFDLCPLDWGDALDEKIQAVRAPSVGVINGCQVVLPAWADGGLEVLVGVEEECLDKLFAGPLWTKFAEARQRKRSLGRGAAEITL
ncbi:hypothetical protein C8A03DRAFT_30340 [Achaetomium macrosporum]|uniref:Trichothecene 3-O-acetyltransferase-like N-terminal domain-containing protein n=1 Tax=Achaetomium macrosporum TaxID=79813 RepID=A0AAN7CGR0_9PEZI|nr:hypothetical protein C8A03DRAFT_30340 [Achaetomium macrosporum]